jgi:serine/threonine protein kinase/Tfp pilus assembly protein PilF
MTGSDEANAGFATGPGTAGLWPEEAPADVRAFLDQHSRLRGDKGTVLDLAYDEYCRLAEAGETPDPVAFCARFPTFQSSLRRVIDAHEYLAANPSLLDGGEAIPWPVEGETFLGFRLLRELGRGGFARVYLAAEPDLGNRLVAVKVSPHGGTEAQTLGRLDHPNVVKVYAVRKDERSGLTAVCMPYLGGATLDNVLAAFCLGRPARASVILDAARAALGEAGEGGGWPTPNPLLEQGSYAEGVCLLGAQVADALAFLHAREIYHRDLKLSNVLLCPDGRPMLLDFNLSADPQAGRERLGGTLPYMSPEQVRATFGPDHAAAEALDGRSDLFSLGVILFELLTGRQPFGAVPRGQPSPEDCAALLARQKAGAPAVRRLCPEATPALARVIMGCLAYERERRPQNAAEVAVALRRDLARHRRALRRVRRHPWQLAAATLLVVGLGSAGAAYVATRPPEAERLMLQAAAAQDRGDNRAALDLADRGVARAPDNALALVRSGELYQRQGRYRLAAKEYRDALALAPNPRVSACLAYCLAQSGNYSESFGPTKDAIDGGFDTPAVQNNLAYSQLNSGHRPEAEGTLDRLLARSPNLPAACHNRLVLRRLQLRLGSRSRGRLPEARAALGQALAVCPASAELFGDAADLCAAAGTLQAGWDDEALTYLEKAVALGLPLGSRPDDVVYKHLLKDARLVALMKAHPEPVPPGPTPRLIDPLGERTPDR